MFQSTRPWGARRAKAETLYKLWAVSIHAPVGGATSIAQWLKHQFPFQSTRPWGARPCIPSSVCIPNTFQSTRPWGARHLEVAKKLSGLESFNPRARGGRDARRPSRQTRGVSFQSTRPWGARLLGMDFRVIIRPVSIHAPVGGATVLGMDFRVIIRPVSIHAPVGGATLGMDFRVIIRPVSIHAPVGGATWRSSRPTTPSSCFNPRARGGRDHRFF